MKAARITLITVAALSLGACATMNEEECMMSDWRTIGYEDGARGYTGDRIGQHRKACAKHGVAPDFEAYQAGRSAGLKEYCQPENGFRVGASGYGLPNVCPESYRESFAMAYRDGRTLYELQYDVNKADAEIRSRQSELDAVSREYQDTQKRILDDDVPILERATLLDDARDLFERKGELTAEIREWEKEKAVREQLLTEYRNGLSYNL
jgi:hypothetical protein